MFVSLGVSSDDSLKDHAYEAIEDGESSDDQVDTATNKVSASKLSIWQV